MSRSVIDVRCFVASAFDRADIDAIYDKCIRAVLRELKVQPVRVDRFEHNDDIDDKIYELLDSAQVCIADLTYARPSVYYEAGYAHASGMPVIYIARRDHFVPQPDDPEGNLRVHFDLQMKNIIRWSKPNDAFKKQLRRRLNCALAPNWRKLKSEKQSKEIVAEFARLPQREKLNLILSKGINLLRRRRFQRSPMDEAHSSSPLRASFHRFGDRAYQQVHIVVRAVLKKSELIHLRNYYWLSPLSFREENRVARRETCMIIASLRKCRDSMLTDVLPSYQKLANGVFRNDVREGWQGKPERNTIRVLDSIESPTSFEKQFREALQEFE